MPHKQTTAVVQGWFIEAGGKINQQGLPIRPQTKIQESALILDLAKAMILQPSRIIESKLAVAILDAAGRDNFWQQPLSQSISQVLQETGCTSDQ